MILPNRPINLIPIAIALTTAILLAACTDEAADSSQVKTAAPSTTTTVTEAKIVQWQKEAQAGDPDAQYNLAYIYENGLGVPKNEAKALELYQQAADQGHSRARNNLNSMSSVK